MQGIPNKTIVFYQDNVKPIDERIYLYNSNFAHIFRLCTLKIQYMAIIQLLKFRCYAVWSCDFNNAGNVFINVSTSSLIFSSDSSVSSLSMVRNIWSSIWNACIHVMSDISSAKYTNSSPSERLSFDSLFSMDSIIYLVKTTAVWAVIASKEREWHSLLSLR